MAMRVKPGTGEVGLSKCAGDELLGIRLGLGRHQSAGSHQNSAIELNAAQLRRIGLKPSYSRPRVSNDNAYAEALFRTAKYRPEFLSRGPSRTGPGGSVDPSEDWRDQAKAL